MLSMKTRYFKGILVNFGILPEFWLENAEYWIVRTLYIGRWSNKSCRSVAVFWKRSGQSSCTKHMGIINSVLFCKNLRHLILVAFWKFLKFGSKILNFELCAHCILDDEATKVVDLLPLFEKGVTKVLAQRTWESFIKFFFAKICVNSSLLLFWKFLNFDSKMLNMELCAHCILDEATKVVDLLPFF